MPKRRTKSKKAKKPAVKPAPPSDPETSEDEVLAKKTKVDKAKMVVEADVKATDAVEIMDLVKELKEWDPKKEGFGAWVKAFLNLTDGLTNTLRLKFLRRRLTASLLLQLDYVLAEAEPQQPVAMTLEFLRERVEGSVMAEPKAHLLSKVPSHQPGESARDLYLRVMDTTARLGLTLPVTDVMDVFWCKLDSAFSDALAMEGLSQKSPVEKLLRACSKIEGLRRFYATPALATAAPSTPAAAGLNGAVLAIDLECKNCGRRNHNVRDCKACRYCKKVGHKERNCYRKNGRGRGRGEHGRGGYAADFLDVIVVVVAMVMVDGLMMLCCLDPLMQTVFSGLET